VATINDLEQGQSYMSTAVKLPEPGEIARVRQQLYLVTRPDQVFV
jgi:hypothetical protein